MPKTDRQILHDLCLEIGHVVPERSAALTASTEVRALRAAWQAALTHLSLTETQARSAEAVPAQAARRAA